MFCVYLNEQLKESSHLLDLAFELLGGGVEQAGGGFNASQPLHGNKHCTLYGCGGPDQLSLGHHVTHKHYRIKKKKDNKDNNTFTFTYKVKLKIREGNPGPFKVVCKLVGLFL